MDRAPANDSAPFLRFERFDAPEDGAGAPRRSPTRLYRAHVGGPASGGESAVIWASLGAMRAALGGIWLETLLAMDGVTLTEPAGAVGAPPVASTLVYLPALTGERHILRACAKYGDEILFAPGHAQEVE